MKETELYLPTEIITHILSRLPVATTIKCKCVCKSWLNLIESLEFTKANVSRYVAAFKGPDAKNPYKVVKFVDEKPYPTITRTFFKFTFPNPKPIYSSVDGLLLLCNASDLYICNPITRDYIKLPEASESPGTLGFGVSKTSSKYKLVKISRLKCEVYTLGTGSWRCITIPTDGRLLKYREDDPGEFLNANLHWVVSEWNNSSSQRISCFDLETELFSSFDMPPSPQRRRDITRTLTALEDRLCICDNRRRYFDWEIAFWVMKEYGDEKSWTKELAVVTGECLMTMIDSPDIKVVKVFKDDEIVIATELWGIVVYVQNS